MELIMKKYIFVLLLISLSNLSSLDAQEKFLSILDSLTVNGDIISIRKDTLSTNSYFEFMAEKQNFDFLNQVAIYTNSYKNFSVFHLFYLSDWVSYKTEWDRDRGIFDDLQMMVQSTRSKQIFLFDNKLQKCFLIEYYLGGSSYNVHPEVAAMRLSAGYKKGILYIYELNEELRPISTIDVVVKVPTIDYSQLDFSVNDGDILGQSIFFHRKKLLLKKYCYINDLKLNLNEITYNDLLDILNIDDIKDVKRIYSNDYKPVITTVDQFYTISYP